MKFVKGVSLFFVFPVVLICIGFLAGLWTVNFFYPGKISEDGKAPSADYNEELFLEDENGQYHPERERTEDGWSGWSGEVADVSSEYDVLNADTEYVRQEVDLLKGSVLETATRVPVQYLGMDREQFLEAMEEYEAHPPLSELERGFSDLEVSAFSAQRVVIKMNYRYVQPSKSFYLAVHAGEIVVLLEDKETIFIHTGIPMKDVPESLQQELIKMLWMPDEKSLYSFLENYSS